MSYYFMLTMSGILALLGVVFLADEECLKRHKDHTQCLHTQLLLYNVPGYDMPLACTLYRADNVLGRRKRRSDICLDCYDDGHISRNHAVLTYDGENFRIKPVFRLNSFRHTEIIVENALVPPQGCVLHYGDRIAIAGHLMQLQNTDETEMRW